MKVSSMEELHRAVGERDNWICQVCGIDYSYQCYWENDRNLYICAHHAEHTRGARPDLALETDICIAICSPCHRKIES